jgi:hypothetical protein
MVNVQQKNVIDVEGRREVTVAIFVNVINLNVKIKNKIFFIFKN